MRANLCQFLRRSGIELVWARMRWRDKKKRTEKECREKERETERKREKQTDRQRDTEREEERERAREREKERMIESGRKRDCACVVEREEMLRTLTHIHTHSCCNCWTTGCPAASCLLSPHGIRLPLAPMTCLATWTWCLSTERNCVRCHHLRKDKGIWAERVHRFCEVTMALSPRIFLRRSLLSVHRQEWQDGRRHR